MSLKIGFIGCGGIAGRHVEALQKNPDAELIAFADPVAEKANALAEIAGGKSYSDFVEMLDYEELDAAFICVPPHVHGAPEKECLSRRVPFLVEKPLGADMATVTDIMGSIRRQAAISAVGYMNRYRRSLQRGRELLRGSRVSTLEAHWIGGTPGAAWWRLKEQSGGQLVEQTTHLLDAIAYLAGRVVEVYAVGAKGIHPDPPEGYNIEDATAVTLKFAGGGVGSVNSACTIGAGGGVGLDIYSPKAVLSYSGWNMDLTATTPDNQVEVVEGEEDIFEIEDAAFLRAVATGDASHIKCDYGQAFHAHQIAMAANRSLESGKPERVSG
jgi:myo-inositol 2-dehydrogenase / D-chiro-inositol 1-dehydrogenase